MRRLAALLPGWLAVSALLWSVFAPVASAQVAPAPVKLGAGGVPSVICNHTYSIQLWIQDNVGVSGHSVGRDDYWEPGFPAIKFTCTGDHVMLERSGHCLKATSDGLLTPQSGRCYAGDKLEMWRLFWTTPKGSRASKFSLRSDALDPRFLGDWGPFPTYGNHKVREEPVQDNFATGLEFM